MKLGVHIGYWGMGLSREDQLAIVQEAERLGYESVWTAEAYGSDAATILGWVAGQTSKIRIGSAIFQMPARSPAMTAMTAATLDQLSGGRMILGIGSSGPQVRLQPAQLAPGRAAGAPAAGEPVPRAREGGEARAAAEHDLMRVDAGEHRLARAQRQAVDGEAQVFDRRAGGSHRLGRPGGYASLATDGRTPAC